MGFVSTYDGWEFLTLLKLDKFEKALQLNLSAPLNVTHIEFMQFEIKLNSRIVELLLIVSLKDTFFLQTNTWSFIRLSAYII